MTTMTPQRILIRVALGLIVLLMVPQTSRAKILDDPAVLNIGTGHGTACAYGCAGDTPNPLGANASLLSIYFNGGEYPALSDPLILILGLPYSGVGSLPTAPVLSSVTFYDEDAEPGSPVTFSSLSLAQNGGDGILSPSDPASHREAYFQARFDTSANDSNSWDSWSSLVPTATAFYLFAYRIDQSIDGGDLLDVAIGGGGLPLGAYAIAYGCEDPATPNAPEHNDALNGNCVGGTKNTYTTLFTEAGFAGNLVNAPEPGSLLLLGVGLLVAGRQWRKSIGRDMA